MIEVLDATDLDRARRAGAIVGCVLQTLKERVRPGDTLLDIDRWAEASIAEAGAQSCYVDYAPPFGRGPFGHFICTAANDAVLHGRPSPYRLADGDLLTLDLAVSKAGIAADAAISFIVGDVRDRSDATMISTTEKALRAGIDAARPDARVGDVSAAIGAVLTRAGYGINTDYGGHGIGSSMHQDPHVPNDGRPGRGYRLRPGMLLALEPWVMADTTDLRTDADGWTLRSATGCRAAHSEHTIAITESGAEVLTRPA